MGRPSRSLLSREIIARAALQLLTEEGPEALKMRTLADRLGVRGASLYHHVASKDDVLDAASELINEEIDLAPLDHPEWREGVTVYARGYRQVYLRHWNVIALVARRRVEADRALRGYDKLLETLTGAGCTPAQAAEAAAALDYLVLGSALETFTAGFARAPDGYRPGHPSLAAALDGAGAAPGGLASLDDRGFERGLAALLASLPPHG
ncbi:TetR/AcrR family transcriptional regulator C-terminal domain-containing protein [Streptomyces sp. MUM 203J]|uniref:TetR/AcrR family transcriptional regulator n=1 Tax=Streptomyces sp. MUM 203J TaxID=2791990 RepID=UPI001F0468AF|nr:TetR/AcrR family transcriptional regulator C-terminal domain-containing protein [Streptomyces sp. MUM 203J]MCH0543116.1 TetR/AcrR family transcriptional regulator C-terminal domain-containing protein [Streptomyces sp. MUM 203J]